MVPELRVIKTACASAAWSGYQERVREYKEKLEKGLIKKNKRPPIIPFGDILADIINDEDRNRLIIDLLARECPGHSSLVLSERVAHCEVLQAMLAARCPRLRSAVIHGKLGKRARRDILARMGSGELDVLFAVDIAKEGLDIPRLDRLFLVAGGRNAAEVEQKVGRIQRSFPGKQNAVVFDFVDDRIAVLKAQHWARRKVYKELGLRMERKAKSA
jgi:superfamily II DNA or RNA helicase